MLDFLKNDPSVDIVLAVCKNSSKRLFRGLQVEPEPRPRRGADGPAVARFPNQRLDFKEDSFYCRNNKIHGRLMVRTAGAARLKLRCGVPGIGLTQRKRRGGTEKRRGER